VKLWDYQHGEILDDVDCSAFVGSTLDTDASSDSHHKSVDIRCMTSSRRLLAVSFNGYLMFPSILHFAAIM